MLYEWTAEQVQKFTRAARKVERAAGRKGGSPFDPLLFLGKMEEAFLSAIPAPGGGRIHVLPGILVREDEDWTQALESAVPDTPADYTIRKVGHLYPPTGKGEVRKDFVLLHRPGWSLDQFLACGLANRLLGTTAARDVFAVGREKHELNRELGMDPIWVHATDVQTFGGFRGVPFVWWGGAERKADHDWVEHVGSAHGWCLFSRESVY